MSSTRSAGNDPTPPASNEQITALRVHLHKETTQLFMIQTFRIRVDPSHTVASRLQATRLPDGLLSTRKDLTCYFVHIPICFRKNFPGERVMAENADTLCAGRWRAFVSGQRIGDEIAGGGLWLKRRDGRAIKTMDRVESPSAAVPKDERLPLKHTDATAASCFFQVRSLTESGPLPAAGDRSKTPGVMGRHDQQDDDHRKNDHRKCPEGNRLPIVSLAMPGAFSWRARGFVAVHRISSVVSSGGRGVRGMGRHRFGLDRLGLDGWQGLETGIGGSGGVTGPA
jgi:hypothetical protein